MLIAQITDIHVSRPGRLFGKHIDSRAAFERAISRVLTLDPKPDLVLLSGDLAETGADEEYDFIATELARLTCRVVAVPGNHDIREAMLRKLPACVSAQHGGHLSFLNEDFPLRVIGLDTIVPGKVHGEICEDRLHWLRDALARTAGNPVLLAMHHPPFTTGLVGMDRYGIKRGLDAFRAIVAQHTNDIVAIVCGHAHRMIVGRVSSVPILLAPACSFPFELDLGEKPSLNFVQEPPQFLVHSWSEAAGYVAHAAFVDAFPGPFPVL